MALPFDYFDSPNKNRFYDQNFTKEYFRYYSLPTRLLTYYNYLVDNKKRKIKHIFLIFTSKVYEY